MNMAHTRLSKPDSGLGFQLNVLTNLSECSLFAQKREERHRDAGLRESGPIGPHEHRPLLSHRGMSVWTL